MKSMMNVLLLIAGAMLALGAGAQTAPPPEHERKASETGNHARAIDAAKERPNNEGAVRARALPTQLPERALSPVKNNPLPVPQIPVDQLGLGCSE
jgi:hypothetical protein